MYIFTVVEENRLCWSFYFNIRTNNGLLLVFKAVVFIAHKFGRATGKVCKGITTENKLTATANFNIVTVKRIKE